MQTDASNRKQIREAEKAAKLREEASRNYLCAAMSTREGRAWFHDLLETCHLFSDPFTGDALREAHSKGERNVGLKIFAQINQWCPDSYIDMIKEANHDRSAAAELPRGEDRDGGVEGTDLDAYDPDADPYLDPIDGVA